MIHSNDDGKLRSMLGISQKAQFPQALVAIYDDITNKKRLGHSTGSYSTTELAFIAREFERVNGGPWKEPPPAQPAAAEQKPAKKELAKAS